MKGGYRIIDFGNVDLAVEHSIAGIYSRIESTDKALLLTNIILDGIEQKSAFVLPTLDGTTYSFSVYGGTITVTDADAVSYTAESE